MEEWELSKENVLPLKQGRKAGNLSAALQPSNTDKSRLLLSERQEFETELRSYQGEDTLDPWYRYFKWTLRNFPQGGKESNLTTLLERCFKHFQSETKYYNDLRFVEIWLQMASMSNHALECYQFMKDQGIGTQCSQFYESWAWELEQLGNTKKADSIYTEGLRNHAQPQERLEKMHKEFQSRISRMTLMQMQEGGMQTTVQQEQRTTLGELRGRGKHHKVGTQRTGAAKLGTLGPQNLSRPMPLGQTSNKPVQIFCDDENDRKPILPGTNKQWKSLPTQDVINKENTVKPGPWNSQSIPQRGAAGATAASAVSKPNFFIHEDVDASVQTPHKPPEMNSHVLSDRKHEPGARSLPFVPEDPNPNAKVMYCKHLVYAGTTEMSFEELRAIKYNERKEKERLRAESEELKAQQALLHQREKELMQREMELLRKRDEQQQMMILKQQQEFLESQRQQELMFKRQQEELMRQQKDMLLHAQREIFQKMPVEDIAMETNRPVGIGSGQEKRDSCGSSENNISCTQRLMFDDITATQTAGLPTQTAPFNHQDKGRTPSRLTPGANITPNCSVAMNSSNASQPKTPSDVASLDSSHNRSNLLARLGSGRTPKGLTQPSPTINTKEALDVIMGALNESLSDVHIGSKLSVLPEEPMIVTIAPTSNNFVHNDASSAFCPVSQTKPRGLSVHKPLVGLGDQKWDGEIFVDPTVNLGTECQKDEECKENIPPEDYQQFKENRGQLAVLQPAVGVPVDPDSAPGREEADEEVEAMVHEQPDVGEVPKTNTTRFQDSTMFQSTNGNISFSTASHMASTPFNGAASLFVPPMSVIKKNSGEASFQDEEGVEGMETDHAGPQRAKVSTDENESLETTEYPAHQCENKVLSPIIETSAEDGRSSSSSSSSSTSSSSNHVSQQKTLHTATLPSITESSFVAAGELSEGAANITLRRGSKRQASQEEEMEIPTDAADPEVFPLNGVQLPGTPGPKSLAEELSEALGSGGDASMLDEEECKEEDVSMREDAAVGDIANGDPFKEELKSLLLSKLSKPLSSYEGFKQTDHPLPNFDIGSAVDINDGQMTCLVTGQCGEGAFAKVFEVQPLILEGSINGKVLKVQKPGCPWEFYISRVVYERITSMGLDKHVLDSLMFADSITVHPKSSCLMMDYHDSGTLLDAINHYQKKGEKMTESMVALFAITILDIVDALHSSKIIHADIKPDNFMLQNLREGTGESCLKLIDFGQSIDMSLFPEGTTFTANCHTSAFSCVEMQTGKPWTYQTDYYGIAGTFHCMLFNTYMKVYQEGNIWKTTALFKRTYKCGWKKIFHTLLNVPSCDPSDMLSLKEISAQLENERNPKYTLKKMKEELNIELF
ncbi:Mitotic checkpoint serine/threonine-protein kinase BUB1 beta [Holothuria leucospilota]|uniref:Mitotic checkpoint serine/threonine-protein kinase BUB1 beta n=1 Tax=Holothuria leucospilota TaxID=206669 RepID=A0A9Q1BC75_HOLLE|nr:Mitotic checkpoint serine/threonine-protein kinase BUB1 beta [Holothuria leucospilota]